MKKIILFLTVFILTGCTPQRSEVSAPGTSSASIESTQPDSQEIGHIPLNYTSQVGLWMPYTHFDEQMCGMNAEEYRAVMSDYLSEASEQGINTVYFHAHPNGDAYYDSSIFPRGKCMSEDVDALAVVTEEAHKLGISVHAWINPLRMQTAAEMEELPESYVVKQWTEQPEKGYVRLVNDRWYLVPVYPEVRSLISSCAAEILEKYDVDGIHIDDYFYPTTDTSFDSEAFAESGKTDLAQWRRDNVTEMVRELCSTVHAYGNRLKFGISPQGNIASDREKLYADVKLWCSDTSYCDYIVPQLYFGFWNEACPFEQTLRDWEDLTSDSPVSLIAGLAEYKLGKTDQWAGEAGKDEWVTSPDILERQIELVKSSTADGYAFYR